MKKYTVNILKGITVTEENFDDIMDTAGYGIAYWADGLEKTRYGWSVHDYEEDEWMDLPRESLLNGIAIYLNWNNQPYEITDGNLLDMGMIDAEVADCIVQFALFGDVIYG